MNQSPAALPSVWPSRRLPRQRESRRIRGAGLRPELQLRLLSAPAHRRANASTTPAVRPPGPRPPSTASRRMRPPGACFRCKAPTIVDATGNYYGAPLTFDHPVKAVFSSDGSTAYILSCGPECGGTTSSYTRVPIAPMIFLLGQSSGLLPTTSRSRRAPPFPFPAGPATRWSIPPPCTSWASSRS